MNRNTPTDVFTNTENMCSAAGKHVGAAVAGPALKSLEEQGRGCGAAVLNSAWGLTPPTPLLHSALLVQLRHHVLVRTTPIRGH